MKNYVVRFMDKSFIQITVQEAAKIAMDWKKGVSVVMINGNLKATHQICSIDRVSREEEKDLCVMNGIDPDNPPTLQKLLPEFSKKLLK